MTPPLNTHLQRPPITAFLLMGLNLRLLFPLLTLIPIRLQKDRLLVRVPMLTHLSRMVSLCLAPRIVLVRLTRTARSVALTGHATTTPRPVSSHTMTMTYTISQRAKLPRKVWRLLLTLTPFRFAMPMTHHASARQSPQRHHRLLFL